MKNVVYLLFALIFFNFISCASQPELSGDEAAEKGFSLSEQGKYAESAEYFEQALTLGFSSFKSEVIYTALGNQYTILSDYDKAVSSYKAALENNPAYYKGWLNLGVVYRYLGDDESAHESYLKALQIEPLSASLQTSLGALYLDRKEYASALVHFKKAVEIDGKLASAWANLSLGYAAVGEDALSKESYEKALELGYAHLSELDNLLDRE